MAERKHLVISYEKITPEILEALEKKYPGGYENYVKRITVGDKIFYAVTVDTADASYLIKINVRIDSDVDEIVEEPAAEESEFPETTEEETQFPANEEEENYD